MLISLPVVYAAWALAVVVLANNNNEKIITHKLHRRSNPSFATGKLSSLKSSDTPSQNSMVLVSDVLSSRATTNTPSTGRIDQDGSDVSYYIEAQFGSDKQNFSVVVDTGSYYTWVYGSNCSSNVCADHRSYNQKNSSTVQATPYTFQIQYSSGAVSGSVVNDIISFSGFETRVDFGLADSAGSTFSSFPIDGIMGLSAKDVSGDKFPGIINTLYNQSLISERIFGVNLGRSSDSDDEGSITFGGLDSSKYTGDISYTPVLGESVLWNINLTSTYMGPYQLDFGGPRSAIVDTGTTLLVLPPSDALKLHSYIQGAQTDGTNFAVPCSTNITLQLGLAGQNWTISPKDYVGSKISEDNTCISNIQGVSSQGNTTWILGDVFLKNVYSVFDVDQQRVGFAEKVVSSTDTTSADSIVYSALSLVSSESITSTSAIIASVTAAGGNQHDSVTLSSSSSVISASSSTLASSTRISAAAGSSTASTESPLPSTSTATSSSSSIKSSGSRMRSVDKYSLIAIFSFALIWINQTRL